MKYGQKFNFNVNLNNFSSHWFNFFGYAPAILNLCVTIIDVTVIENCTKHRTKNVTQKQLNIGFVCMFINLFFNF